MPLWCEGCPVVSPAQASQPKLVTLVLPFYQAHAFLHVHLRQWASYDDALRARFAVVIVDDGSPTPLTLPNHVPCDIRVFRIGVDVPWNWLAARNIGAHHAVDGWLLLTDMDHILPPDTLAALQNRAHDPSVVYALARREHTGQPIHPHSASFFMTKAMFWRVGGYDERLSGVYGTDGIYRRRLAAHAPIHLLADALVRHEYVDDASVTAYERKTPAMRAAKAARLRQLRPGPPATLTFPYHEVTTCVQA